MEQSMRKFMRVSSVASAVAVTAVAGWYGAVAIAVIVLPAVLLISWVLVDEGRTRRLIRVIRALRDRAASGIR